MKRLSNYRHPSRTEFPGIPPVMDEPLKVIGKQIRELTELQQGQSTLEGNGNYELRTVTTRHDQEFSLGLQALKGPPAGGVCIFSSAGEIPEVKEFTVVGEKSVRWVLYWRHNVPAGDVTVRLLILGS